MSPKGTKGKKENVQPDVPAANSASGTAGPKARSADEVGAARAAASGIEADALAEAESENKKLFDQLIRLKAEFENFRKRVDRDKPALIRHGRDEVLAGLLPLYDALLSAHEELGRSSETGGGEGGEIVRGLQLTFVEFTKFFEAEGITVMDAKGSPYDVNRHEVLGQMETEEFEEGAVVEVIQRGYLIRGATLRTAKVRIAKKKS